MMKRTEQLDLERHIARTAAEMKRRAATGLHTGRDDLWARAYLQRCTVVDERTGWALIFTRDAGHHTSGWMKNPDYERCLHVSTSARPPLIISSAHWEPDTKVRDMWLRALLGEGLRHAWAESPKTPHGKRIGVWHWRVFCNVLWVPIHPRGEVYSKELTELGWKSASEVGAIIESPLNPE